MSAGDPRSETLHASCVACDGVAVLVLGASGAGKSTLVLDLMARGGVLVADDRTIVTRAGGAVIASVPAAIRGRIEARGIGILGAEDAGATEVGLVVKLGTAPPPRLPERQRYAILGVEIDLICAAGPDNLGPAIWQYLKGGRVD